MEILNILRELGELSQIAQLVGGLLAIVSVGGPIALGHFLIPKLGLAPRGPFLAIGEICSLAAFLAPIIYRQFLHFMPAAIIFLGVGTVLLVLLVILASFEKGRSLLVALPVFAITITCIMYSLTTIVVEEVAFKWVIDGTVSSTAGTSRSGCKVYLLEDGGANIVAESKTGPKGYYKFLLSYSEREDVAFVSAKAPRRSGMNWLSVPPPPDRNPYKVTKNLQTSGC